jgi:hypothetical protein
MLALDHVVVGVHDLDAAAERLLREHGLGSVPGGRHAGWGTANRIVPLGPDYLELLAIVDQAEAATSMFGRWVAEAGVEEEDRLLGWCLRTDDVDAVAAPRALVPVPGERALPDGTTLTWRVAGRDDRDASLPFFVEWQVPEERRPGRAAAEHAVEPRGIAWLEVAGDGERIRAWLGDAALPLRIVEGAPQLRAVAISTESGEIVLRA